MRGVATHPRSKAILAPYDRRATPTVAVVPDAVMSTDLNDGVTAATAAGQGVSLTGWVIVNMPPM